MRKTIFADGEFYHLYNRGVDKRVTFDEKREYERFLAYLYMLNTSADVRPADFFLKHSTDEAYSLERLKPLVAIGAYCLMPNHFHLYVTPLEKDGVSKFMQRVQTAYTMYFNKKHERSGVLFQGAFKAEHVDREQYAKYLFSYIHLNPAKLKDRKWKDKGRRDLSGLGEYLRGYPYSSLSAYISGKHRITDPSRFPAYLAHQKDVDEHIDSWLNLREAEPHG